MLFGKFAKSVNLSRVDLSYIGQSLVLAEQNIDLLLELGVFIGGAGALLLRLKQLLLDLEDDLLVLVAQGSDLGLVLHFKLNLEFLAALNRLCHHLIQLGNHLFPILELALVLFFLAKEKVLELTSLVPVLILDNRRLGLRVDQLSLQLLNLPA